MKWGSVSLICGTDVSKITTCLDNGKGLVVFVGMKKIYLCG
jgi:hypothetical protein